MTTEQKLDRLTDIVDSLASGVVHHDSQIELLASGIVERDAQIAAHDRQIEALIQVAEKNSQQIAKTERAIASLERQWQGTPVAGLHHYLAKTITSERQPKRKILDWSASLRPALQQSQL